MTNEKARDGQVAGSDQNTNTHEGEQIMTQDTTTPEYAATDVAEALRLIDAGSVPCIDLEPSDALWQEILDVRIKPACEMRGYEVGELVSLAPLFDISGHRVEQPANDWWAAAEADVPGDVRRYWKHTPNTAIRLGGLLAISHGPYRVAAEFEVDGVLVVELITMHEERRRQQSKKDTWLNEHPELPAAAPQGARLANVDFEEDGVSFLFEREIGAVTLAWPGVFSDGEIRFDDRDNPEVLVIVGNRSEEVKGVAEMRALASDLMAAIPVVEAATA